MKLLSKNFFDDKRYADVSVLSKQVFGRLPERVAFPGGMSRSAFVVDMGDAAYVFAKRGSLGAAQLEADVLETLAYTGLVPKLKTLRKRWVIQEVIPGARLPVALDRAKSMGERVILISKALDSLFSIQEAALSQGLEKRVPEIGIKNHWVWNRTGAAKRMSKQINIAAPDLDRKSLTKRMSVERTEFVKWDARPGNALVNDKGVFWFDWEDCGRGCAIDDFAFVLCDEWTSLDAVGEKKIELDFLSRFNRKQSIDEAHEYLRVFGLTHTVLRLRMALKLQLKKGQWWDRDMCLSGDKIGVTLQETSRLISRGKRWADDVAELRPYISWLDEIAGHFDIPDCTDASL